MLRTVGVIARIGVRPFQQRRYLSTVGTDTTMATSNDGLEVRMKMLTCALEHVPKLGWTEDALVKAATEVGLPPLSYRLVERGPVEIVELFIKNKRAHVRNVMHIASVSTSAPSSSSSSSSSSSTESLAGPQDALYLAIEAHLDYIAPFVTSWPSALALMAEPQQLPRTFETMMDTVEDLCEFAGIQNSRGDWYVERGLLLSLFCSTELYFLTDTSANFSDTKEFLRSGLRNINSLKKTPSSIFSPNNFVSALTGIMKNTNKHHTVNK
jgi:ubiquinone biosynthesis protein COQ9